MAQKVEKTVRTVIELTESDMIKLDVYKSRNRCSRSAAISKMIKLLGL
jgi:hypothetical protein